MKAISKIILAVLLVSLAFCNGNGIVIMASDYEMIQFEKVAFEKLLDNPEMYNQKHIEINGYAVFGFETTALYIDQRSSDNMAYEKGVWIIPDATITQEQRNTIEADCNRKYVKIKGIVDSKAHGHLGFYKAEVKVKYIELL